MKKSVILGMVFVTAMSFSAHGAPAGKGLFERVAEGRAPLQQALYGTEKVLDKDGKVMKDKEGKDIVRAISLASLPEAARRSKQDALINKLTGDKATELRDYLRSSPDKATELARTETLEQLLLTKEYAESVKDSPEAAEVLAATKAVVKLLANSTRARDRKDEATITLSEQAGNILKWTSAQRKNVTEIVELQDKYMTEGMDSRSALDRAYSEVRKVSLEVAKKAVDKIRELCKA